MSAILTPAAPVPYLAPALAARRAMARRVAWVLWPGAITARGYVSTELVVTLAGGRRVQPDVSFAPGEPPVGGVLGTAPCLAVLLPGRPPAAAEALLAAGSRIVWRLEDDAVVVQTPKRRLRRTGEQLCHVPRQPALALTAAELLTAAGILVVEEPALGPG
jgi:hypothetical protein